MDAEQVAEKSKTQLVKAADLDALGARWENGVYRFPDGSRGAFSKKATTRDNRFVGYRFEAVE